MICPIIFRLAINRISGRMPSFSAVTAKDFIRKCQGVWEKVFNRRPPDTLQRAQMEVTAALSHARSVLESEQERQQSRGRTHSRPQGCQALPTHESRGRSRSRRPCTAAVAAGSGGPLDKRSVAVRRSGGPRTLANGEKHRRQTGPKRGRQNAYSVFVSQSSKEARESSYHVSDLKYSPFHTRVRANRRNNHIFNHFQFQISNVKWSPV